MQKKAIAYTAFLCSFTLLFSGCSAKKENDFDPAAYTTAYLDGMIRGEVDTLSSLSGIAADELTKTFDTSVSDLVSLSVGSDGDAPGSIQISPQLRQNYIDFWKKALHDTKYDVKNAKKNDDSYQVTVATQQMQLYTAMEPVYTDKLSNASPDTTDSDAYQETLYQLMLESYQSVLDNVTYNDPEDVTVTLRKDDSSHWSISDDDMNTLKKALVDSLSFDTASSETDETPTQVTAEDIANSESEGAPNLEYPENLGSTPAYKVGDTVTLQDKGKDVATFTIDKVEVTDERSEYDTSNPEKVILITYTYKNLAFDDPLLYDQMSFRILDGKTVCLPYYLTSLTSAELAQAGGDAVTATVSYGVSASCNEVTIYVDGVQIASPFQVSASVS